MPRRKTASVAVKKKTSSRAAGKTRIKHKKEEIADSRVAGAQPAVYSRISSSFLMFVIFVVAVIFYFSFSKISIKIFPKKETVSVNFAVDVAPNDNANSPQMLSGKVLNTFIEQGKDFQVDNIKELVNTVATGNITIINNYSRDQILVATTRFLSPEGKLFRLKDKVVVPASQSIEAEVYADQQGEEYEIGPAKFTIPGLWKGIQDKIYGESKAKMERKKMSVGILTNDDIEAAKEELNKIIYEKARQELKEKAGDGKYRSVLVRDVISTQVSDIPGAEISSFNVKSKIKVIGIFISESDLTKEALNQLSNELAHDKRLLKLDETKLDFTVKNYNLEDGSAQVEVRAEGIAVVSENSSIFDKTKLRGMSRQEVKNYFLNMDDIDGVEVKFSPFWIFNVPRSLSRIKLEIAQ